MKDTTFLPFLLLLVGAAVFAYFIFFNKKKHAYPEEKIKAIFDTVSDFNAHHADDHQFVTTLKEKLSGELVTIKRSYSRTPSMYTKDEVSDLETMLPEAKQSMRDVCVNMIDLKPKLIALIEAKDNEIQARKGLVESIVTKEESIRELKESIIGDSSLTSEAKEEELRKLKEAVRHSSAGVNENEEDLLDDLEKHIEDGEVKLLKYKIELANLEKSLIKYQSI